MEQKLKQGNSMDIKLTLKIRNFVVPESVFLAGRVGRRQDGLAPSSQLTLSELDSDTLSNLCDQFRKDVFAKANKPDPREMV